jgi:RNA polymerase sigma factor (sigma-70 family)
MSDSIRIPFPSARAGNPSATGRQAFAVLAREHHRGLLVYARALSRNEATSADLVQDAFVTAWKNLDRFDTARDFGAWLRGIVRNKWREHLRRHAREVDVDDETLEAWEFQLARWDDSRRSGNPELFDALDDCLQRLPAAMGDAVNRFYYREQSADSIAAALGIDAATLRKRLQRAREALRACLDRKLPNHAPS